MFKAGMKESVTKKIEMKSMTTATCWTLLHFIYTGIVYREDLEAWSP